MHCQETTKKINDEFAARELKKRGLQDPGDWYERPWSGFITLSSEEYLAKYPLPKEE